MTEKRLGEVSINGSWTPQNGPIVVHQLMSNHASMTVAKKEPTLKHTVRSLPDKVMVVLGRTLSGHHHDDRLLKQEFPPESDGVRDIQVRVD